MRRQQGSIGAVLGVCVSLVAGCVTPGRIATTIAPDDRAALARPMLTAAEAGLPQPEKPSPYHVTPSEPAPRLEAPPPIRSSEPEVQTTAAPAPPTPEPSPPVVTPAEHLILTAPDEPLLVSALRDLLGHRPDEAKRKLARPEQQDPELVLALLTMASRLGNGAHSPDLVAREEARKELAATLKARAPLDLGTVCFCSEVRAFGLYKPLPPERHQFQAGVNGLPGEPMQLYIEVADFLSVPREGGFETRLSATVTIEDPHKQPVAQITFPPRAERSLTQRHDYFIVLTIPVPERLPVGGPYTLRLIVRDETPASDAPPGSRIKERTLDFRVIERAADTHISHSHSAD